MLDLIETRSESPENIKRIKFVKRSTNSLRQIIDDILDITRLQNGRIELNPTALQARQYSRKSSPTVVRISPRQGYRTQAIDLTRAGERHRQR
jgi:signal transduction histidine kinase